MGSVAAKVTSKGQITIPTSVREDFGIEKGDELVFYKGLDGRIAVRIRRPRKGSGARSVDWTDPPRDKAEMRGAAELTLDEKHGTTSSKRAGPARS